MNGVIVLDKPTGLSSNQAMGKVKRLLSQSKMGFLGTLDPLATGVLPLFLGKATKLIPAFEKLEKEYRVSIKLGERTDTFDSEGDVIEVNELGDLTPDQVGRAILSFQGSRDQEVPSFSAVKFNGVPAYKLARKGKPVPRRVRRVELKEMAIEEIQLPRAVFRVTCSAGTYMRSLVEEIGEKTGVGAHVTALERIKCGNLFTSVNSIKLLDIEMALKNGEMGFIRNPAEFLPDYWPLTVEDGLDPRLKNGQSIPISPQDANLTPPAKIKAILPGGELIAIGEAVRLNREGLVFKPKKVLI